MSAVQELTTRRRDPREIQSQALALPRGRQLALAARPRIMGVLNVTPDSFSDGGLWLDPEAAVARGLEMLREGADLLDLGAESTRPGGGVYGGGADPVPADEELRRLLPVLTRLRAATDAPLSVDTRKPEVAREALLAGADLINDVTGLSDAAMRAVVGEAGCPAIVMHARGDLPTMQRQIRFADVVAEVAGELARSVERAVADGVPRERLLVDPGIGFGKTAEHNLALLRNLAALHDLGCPVVVGASRKSFISAVSDGGPDERLGGSLAAVGWAALQGVAVVRVHDVAATAQFLRLWEAIAGAGENDR
ncbi:MAG: dihydropteroate synthase [Thermoanaerobaculia bacterium]